jgi:DNA repair protein RecN (Recombination protein N)
MPRLVMAEVRSDQMLTEIHVDDFALIKQAYLEFDQGLNILTGETGAGKTLLVNAINLLLGDRADISLIRSGEQKASIEGLFSFQQPAPHLELQDLLCAEGEDVVISRDLLVSGKTKSYLNGRIVALNQLRELGEKMVDLHGQHEHQSLLKAQNQLEYLDSFGGSDLLQTKESYMEAFSTLAGRRQQLRKKRNDQADIDSRQELLKFQINEIELANLQPGEEEELRKRRQILTNSEKLHQAMSRCTELVSGSDKSGANVLDLLAEATAALKEVKDVDSELDQIYESMESTFFQIEDYARSVREHADRMDFDPALLDEIETRLDCLSPLKRKYGSTVEAILEFKSKAQCELDAIVELRTNIEELESEISHIEKKLAVLGSELSSKRSRIAEIFQDEVQSHLSDLNMPKVEFKVDQTHEPDESGLFFDGNAVRAYPDGIDRIEYFISPNPGEPLKPLNKIISGGELSRVMLALKIVLANVDNIATLIFDEIDSGVGGKTAFAIGKKLAELTRNYQIICITHLPQIACFADRHFVVDKREKKGKTNVSVRLLNDEGREEELSRLLSGQEVSTISRKHAAEILQEASDYKKNMRKGWYAAV